MTLLPLVVGLLVILCGLCGFMVWNQMRTPTDDRSKELLGRKDQEIGELKTTLKSEESEKNKLAGANKQMYAELVAAKEELKSSVKERDALKKQVSEFEAHDKQKEKEHQQQLTQLTQAQKSFEDEKMRVLREDAQQLRELEEERDRVWNEHENKVIATLTALCELPQSSFPSFSNTNLPEGFDGSLKPDFMIAFLDQYVIFDAKASKAESLQTYITNAVKTTAQKVKKNNKIASFVYLVVPTQAISELKKTYFVQDGYTFYVVSPEALPSILASLKRITTYELAEQWDPKQRENIINMIADMDYHINNRNALDLIMAKAGTGILEKTQKVDPELAKEIHVKKQEMSPKNINPAELKKLVGSIVLQNAEIEELVAPKPAISAKELQKFLRD